MTTTAIALRTYDFSWERATKRFRFRDGDQEIFAKELEGYAFIESADGASGHMQITCRLEAYANGRVNIWLEPGDAEMPSTPVDAEFADQWQLCFNRKGENWRVWDKADRAGTLIFTSGYRGPAYISWHDGGGHIFVHGRKWVQDGVVHFAGDRP